MHTLTWSLVSRSARPGPGSRWPGTAVVAAVSSVTSLLRAGHRVAAHLQATYRHRPVPRNTPRRPVGTPRRSAHAMKPGFHHPGAQRNPGFITHAAQAQACLVSQKILLISSILDSSSSALATLVLPLVPAAPASLVASLNSWFSCGYFSKCGGLK